MKISFKDDFIDILAKRVITTYHGDNVFCGKLIDPIQNVPFSVLFKSNSIRELSWLDF